MNSDLEAVLRSGVFEGIPFRIISRAIEEGDTYLAARNTKPQLLTARKVNWWKGWVVPVESAYVFNIEECFPIEFLC